jgi:CxxC-x17-CxxC domain-containing protein
MSKDIIYFAETTFRRQRKKVGIKTDDRRRHVYTVGKTGMGKTEMIKNMIIQDIENGHGVGIVDPHGELAEEILELIPSNRINDVVYFNPADTKYPIAFNVMESVKKGHHHFVASGLMDVFKKIWPGVWSSRMEYILENTILALLETPNSTLLGVNRMMADKKYREKIVNNVEDIVVKSFWLKEFKKYPQRYKSESTAAIQNKIGQLISNPLIRNIVGQVSSKINCQEILNEKKILIANLSKGKIGEENSKLLGSLLVTKLQLAAMTRVNIPEEEREDFFLYVDEFQNFATESFANILSEARKYRLCLTLANQYLSQLTEMTSQGAKSYSVRNAIFGNVGTLIVFRVGAEDAEFLEKEFAPSLYAQDLVDLGKFQIYLKLMVDGLAGRPFSAETLPPIERSRKSHAEKIIKVCRERYASKQEDVEDKIEKWSGLKKEKTFDANCSRCGKKVQVPFKPDGVRPVYCQDCFKTIQREESEKEEKKSKKKQEKKVKKEKEEKKIEKEVSLDSIKDEEEKEKKKKYRKKKPDIQGLKKVLDKALKKRDQNNNEED